MRKGLDHFLPVLTERIPELAPLALRATALRPRPGTPTARDSSVGGPVLWPADEPWPHCEQPGHAVMGGETRPAGRVPLVPVVQLFARDVPELRFPEGKDLLQLLWCTLIHPREQDAPLPALHWRAEADVLARGVLRDIPRPAEGEYEDEFLPTPPCTVSPVVSVDHPNQDLPEDLRARVLELDQGFDRYPELACVLETKAGGYPAWIQPPDWPVCDCGERMEHLLSVTGDEHVDMDMGDGGGVYVFLCRRCPGFPVAHRHDCH